MHRQIVIFVGEGGDRIPKYIINEARRKGRPKKPREGNHYTIITSDGDIVESTFFLNGEWQGFVDHNRIDNGYSEPTS